MLAQERPLARPLDRSRSAPQLSRAKRGRHPSAAAGATAAPAAAPPERVRGPAPRTIAGVGSRAIAEVLLLDHQECCIWRDIAWGQWAFSHCTGVQWALFVDGNSSMSTFVISLMSRGLPLKEQKHKKMFHCTGVHWALFHCTSVQLAIFVYGNSSLSTDVISLMNGLHLKDQKPHQTPQRNND